MPKEIATLPPLAELKNETPLSPRTGEPRRPAAVAVAAVVLYLAVAAVAFSYGWHWFRAAYSETYPGSAHLTVWLEPEPGKWVSLFLEFVYAGLVGLTGAAAGVVGFHAWNGERWTRWGGLVALALTGLLAGLVNLWALIALGLVVLGLALLFTPPVGRYFREWDDVRSRSEPRYRRPTAVVYGRLPRYR
ncbi:hypothetical protein [Tessaracoccus oleiagri]|uniref:Uncharacterized protein n=1 Tax=Tessaracoccus oleiagri TaxID=686624 RepID=A0A1G9N3E7_9ACTN|nr:hypothetical protein [Tessaracoccus oleiagri]SDL80781.1 hypothetical protein SAMN04488242_2906 [Tessaracoccus oleiagri]